MEYIHALTDLNEVGTLDVSDPFPFCLPIVAVFFLGGGEGHGFRLGCGLMMFVGRNINKMLAPSQQL